MDVVGSPPILSTTESARIPGSTPLVAPSQVHPADCGCGCGGTKGSGSPALVYALGMIGYDFGSEARRDAFAQSMGGTGNPADPPQLLAHLTLHPYEAASLIWTLNLDSTPIYAICPAGPFANIAYDRLREFVNSQLTEGVQRVSIPGVLAGQARLFSGQVVPVVVPELRGMYSWSTIALVQAVLGPPPEAEAERARHDQQRGRIQNFLDRVYYELRNLGLSAQDRAMNFAATNAFQVERVFASAATEVLELDGIDVETSPICRPDSDCWDVKLTFFDPVRRLDRARRVYRFTIDVSDVVPVTVSAVRSWSVY